MHLLKNIENRKLSISYNYGCWINLENMFLEDVYYSMAGADPGFLEKGFIYGPQHEISNNVAFLYV